MFKIAQKFKKRAACLLLFSFLNIMTFLPAAAFNIEEVQLIIEDDCDEEPAGATVLELLLENLAGLTDYLPESEKQDFGYDYFSFKSRMADCISPTPIFNNYIPPIVSTIEKQFIEQWVLCLPRLQHHHFIFRLTPF